MGEGRGPITWEEGARRFRSQAELEGGHPRPISTGGGKNEKSTSRKHRTVVVTPAFLRKIGVHSQLYL